MFFPLVTRVAPWFTPDKPQTSPENFPEDFDLEKFIEKRWYIQQQHLGGHNHFGWSFCYGSKLGTPMIRGLILNRDLNLWSSRSLILTHIHLARKDGDGFLDGSQKKSLEII